jgi:pyridoxine 4-dehydrogenase
LAILKKCHQLRERADAYGPETNELLIAEALYPYPKGLVIATKGGNTRRKVPVEGTLGALKKAHDAGKIRHVGLSVVTVAEIERAKKVVPIVSIQNRYNITDRDSEDVLNYCEKEKMGFIAWAPIGGSGSRSLSRSGNPLEAETKRHNVSVVQLALAWLLQKSPVMLPIPGTSSLAHLEENMAAEKLQLTAEEWKRIEALARKS